MLLTPRLLPALALAALTTFSACKKDQTSKEEGKEEITAHADDQNNISTELDAVATEAGALLESEAGFSGRFQEVTDINSICGATAVADTTSSPRKITVTYNGNNCFGTHHRSGVLVISAPAGTRWKNPGAALTLSFQNFKIKRLSDNKSVIINGSQTMTNVNGGLLYQLPVLGTLTHTISSSNMSITFDDNTQRVWQIARKRVISVDNNQLVLTITGNHTNGSTTGIAEWGSNRFGHDFTSRISAPLIFRQDCGGRLTSGAIEHEGVLSASVTFGLNASGTPTGCPSAGSYYYRLNWTGPMGNSHTVILPY